MKISRRRLCSNAVSWVVEKTRKDGGLVVQRVEPSVPLGSCWVTGAIRGHRFWAKVYPHHAIYPSFEIGQSRISKLSVRRLSDGEEVAAFDRGWDRRPTTSTAVKMVNVLVRDLADTVFRKHEEECLDQSGIFT